MKKKLRLLASAAMVTAALTAAAGASNFDASADMLRDVGLFQGTNQGYGLDRAPTRAEAATMLVRMLGKEEEARQLDYTAPFQDLNGWEKPYVQYLYDNGLTIDSSDNTFDPNSKCSAQMYTTFMLRALGYSDMNGDFTYDGAVDFARKINLIDRFNCDENNFLRDHVVAMGMTALGNHTKGSDVRLLDQLVESGAIDKTKAEPLTQFFDGIDAFAAANAESANVNKMDVTANVQASVKMGDVDILSMSMPLQMQIEADANDLKNMKMAMTGTVNIKTNPLIPTSDDAITQDIPIEYYFADGTYYMNMMGEKVKMEMPLDTIIDLVQENSSTRLPVSLVKSLSKTDNVYTLTYNEAVLNSFINKILGSLGALGSDTKASINNLTLSTQITDNKLASFDIKSNISTTVAGQSMDMDMFMKYTVNKTGNEVIVTLPDDLSSYEELLADTSTSDISQSVDNAA